MAPLFVLEALVPEAPHLLTPDICLYGSVDDQMFHQFQRGLRAAPVDQPLVVEMMTFGGDADVPAVLRLKSASPSSISAGSSTFSARPSSIRRA